MGVFWLQMCCCRQRKRNQHFLTYSYCFGLHFQSAQKINSF